MMIVKAILHHRHLHCHRHHCHHHHHHSHHHHRHCPLLLLFIISISILVKMTFTNMRFWCSQGKQAGIPGIKYMMRQCSNMHWAVAISGCVCTPCIHAFIHEALEIILLYSYWSLSSNIWKYHVQYKLNKLFNFWHISAIMVTIYDINFFTVIGNCNHTLGTSLHLLTV